MTALFLVMTLLASPVTVELHYMPPGTDLKLSSGEQVRYFNFEEYKLLLKLDMDHWELHRQLGVYRDLDLKYNSVVLQKDLVIKSLLDDKKILGDQLLRAEQNWHAAEKRYVEASGGPIWPYFLAAGGAVLGIVGLSLYLASLSHSQ